MPGAARPELLAPEGMSLAAKAERYRIEVEERFLSPERTLQYVKFPGESALQYGNHADVPIWSGALAGAEALRFLVTRDADARQSTLDLLKGLNFLQEVTGVRGLLARNAVLRSALPPHGDTIYYDGAPPHEEFLFRSDVSKDQYAGALFAYAMAHFALPDDPEVSAAVRAGASAIADHLIGNGYRIVDVDGEMTTHGDLRVRWGGIVPIGLNAVISLLAVRLAHLSTGDERYADAYRELVRDGAAGAAYWSKFQVFGKTNPNNDNMQILVNLPLALLEPEPEIRALYLAALARTWEYVRLDGNSFFTFAVASVLPVEPRAIEEARGTLLRFPAEKLRMKIDVTDRGEFGRAFFRNRKGVPKATGPIPISYRAPSSFAWRDDPLALVSGRNAESGTRIAGADYLVAYWLGRATGFISASD